MGSGTNDIVGNRTTYTLKERDDIRLYISHGSECRTRYRLSERE